MEINDAKLAIDQIMNEECQRPTIGYEDTADEWFKLSKEMTLEEVAARSKIMSVPRKNLWAQRQESPRPVTETPHIFRFGGTNFDLLMSVYGGVSEEMRLPLVDHILQRVKNGGTRLHSRPESYTFPTLDGKVCELPLVVEFCVRTGNSESFFAATAKPMMPTTSLAIMTMQLAETVALNWNWFSKEQLGAIPKWLAHLREIADRQTHFAYVLRGESSRVENPHYIKGYEREAREIVKAIDGIARECEQARSGISRVPCNVRSIWKSRATRLRSRTSSRSSALAVT